MVMPRPPSSDPFPQLWLNIGNSQCITWRKKVMSKKKDFLVLYFFSSFLSFGIFGFCRTILPWIVFKVACDGDVDHHHDDDDEPEKAFLLSSAMLTHPQIRLQRVTCASPTPSQA